MKYEEILQLMESHLSSLGENGTLSALITSIPSSELESWQRKALLAILYPLVRVHPLSFTASYLLIKAWRPLEHVLVMKKKYHRGAASFPGMLFLKVTEPAVKKWLESQDTSDLHKLFATTLAHTLWCTSYVDHPSQLPEVYEWISARCNEVWKTEPPLLSQWFNTMQAGEKVKGYRIDGRRCLGASISDAEVCSIDTPEMMSDVQIRGRVKSFKVSRQCDWQAYMRDTLNQESQARNWLGCMTTHRLEDTDVSKVSLVNVTDGDGVRALLAKTRLGMYCRYTPPQIHDLAFDRTIICFDSQLDSLMAQS